MTTPLTPEVMAAMERLRGYYCGPWPTQYNEPGGTVLHEQDRDRCLRAMLSLFHPGMPAPRIEYEVIDEQGDGINCADADSARRFAAGVEGMTIYRICVIPLERLETP